MAVPLISVITVSFNAAQTIQQTIDSVCQQTFANYEHIIIDGASTDGTVEILQDNSDRLGNWISEPDAGIAEAMNKGVQLAVGKYLFFLQADDYLVDSHVFENISRLLQSRSAEILAFPVMFMSGHTIQVLKPQVFSFKSRFKHSVRHQGVFTQKAVFDLIGGFDCRYKITMDLEHLFRAREAGFKMAVGRERVAVMRDGGLSSRRDWPSVRQRLLEERAVYLKYYRNFVARRVYLLFSATYLTYKRLRTTTPGVR